MNDKGGPVYRTRHLVAPSRSHPSDVRGDGSLVDCNGTGFRGRQAIIEFMGMNDELRELLVNRASIRDVKLAARRGGMQTLRESALEKVRMGITTFAEINKVTFREGA